MRAQIIPEREDSLDDLVVRARNDKELKRMMRGKLRNCDDYYLYKLAEYEILPNAIDVSVSSKGRYLVAILKAESDKNTRLKIAKIEGPWDSLNIVSDIPCANLTQVALHPSFEKNGKMLLLGKGGLGLGIYQYDFSMKSFHGDKLSNLGITPSHIDITREEICFMLSDSKIYHAGFDDLEKYEHPYFITKEAMNASSVTGFPSDDYCYAVDGKIYGPHLCNCLLDNGQIKDISCNGEDLVAAACSDASIRLLQLGPDDRLYQIDDISAPGVKRLDFKFNSLIAACEDMIKLYRVDKVLK
jgi:hypothetical protein